MRTSLYYPSDQFRLSNQRNLIRHPALYSKGMKVQGGRSEFGFILVSII
jgi:hypothetical protein